MPLILGTNSIKDTGYDVDNSLRFNEGSSDTLTRTPSSAGNRRTWTYSAWHKPEAYSSAKAGRFLVAQTDSNNLVDFAYGDNGTLYLGIYEGGAWKEVITNAYNRDPSAWLHMVVAVDTTQGTDSNRVKVYVNGVHQTSLSRANYPSQNYETSLNNTVLHIMGSYTGNSIYYNGYMAEVCLIDGQALAPTSFGEFDSDSPTIWKPKDFKDDVTFGTNGFYLDFKDSSALGNDAAGSNNFTVNNLTAIDQSTDTCTNNFATLNPLDNYYGGATFSEGNLKIVTGSGNYTTNHGTIALASGKWFWEVKVTSSSTEDMIGVRGNQTRSNYDFNESYDFFYNSYGRFYDGSSGSQFVSYGATFGTGDIIGVALDLDSGTNTIQFYKNGAAQGSKNITNVSSTTIGFYNVAVGDYTSGASSTFEINFGSPTFSISSGNTDGNGYGNFEYAVPSGYYALNTKNLAQYG
nr:spry domain protein [uncultured Mediterranean phage uvMED]